MIQNQHIPFLTPNKAYEWNKIHLENNLQNYVIIHKQRKKPKIHHFSPIIFPEKKTKCKKNSKELQKIARDTAGVQIDLIHGFYLAESNADFTWFRKGKSKTTPELQEEYYIYRTPYVSDQAFSLESLIQMRDSVLANHVKADVPDGEMSTEIRFEVMLDTISHNGKFATLMKGLWKIPAKFMGGPFVSLSFLDKEAQEIITIEGNVYAPHDKKREFMREIESIVRTAKEI